jgi:hypothetical protein
MYLLHASLGRVEKNLDTFASVAPALGRKTVDAFQAPTAHPATASSANRFSWLPPLASSGQEHQKFSLVPHCPETRRQNRLVLVANQEANDSGGRPASRSADGLLCYPRRARSRRAARDAHTAAPQFDEEQHGSRHACRPVRDPLREATCAPSSPRPPCQGPSVRRRCVDNPTAGCLARNGQPAFESHGGSAGARLDARSSTASPPSADASEAASPV